MSENGLVNMSPSDIQEIKDKQIKDDKIRIETELYKARTHIHNNELDKLIKLLMDLCSGIITRDIILENHTLDWYNNTIKYLERHRPQTDEVIHKLNEKIQYT